MARYRGVSGRLVLNGSDGSSARYEMVIRKWPPALWASIWRMLHVRPAVAKPLVWLYCIARLVTRRGGLAYDMTGRP